MHGNRSNAYRSKDRGYVTRGSAKPILTCLVTLTTPDSRHGKIQKRHLVTSWNTAELTGGTSLSYCVIRAAAGAAIRFTRLLNPKITCPCLQYVLAHEYPRTRKPWCTKLVDMLASPPKVFLVIHSRKKPACLFAYLVLHFSLRYAQLG